METTFTKNPTLLAWLDEKIDFLKPAKVFGLTLTGADDALRAEAVETGEMIKLNDELLPDCYLHRTAENDVARVEARTLSAQPRRGCRPHKPLDGSHECHKMLDDIARALMRAEQCISTLIQWVPLVLRFQRSVLRSRILFTLFLIWKL
jgi:phosphoenolpyruvate carboxykinase (GTP)